MNFRLLLTGLLFITIFASAQTTPSSEQLYQQAYDNFVKKDYPAASAALDKINAVDQKKADVLNLRGAIYKRLGELDNAANAYNDALKINPKDWVPKYNLAEVNFLQEQYKSARTFLEQALASMPETDRLQKQDLILYKVYLTYLLQGDEDKAKLLLDNFDINSATPVYYFAQAAWSFKKKDTAKAKTWVDSTNGLYSADLRNSYSQSLVDIGWLEPSAGMTTAVVGASPTAPGVPDTVASASGTASPMVSAAPADSTASATPAAAISSTQIVPLASGSATPVASLAAASAVPSVAPSATVSPEASPMATVILPDVELIPAKSAAESSVWKIILGVVVLLGLAGIVLINLAKRSRIVPAPVDNTGYAAIAASSDPSANPGTYHAEGTGAVIYQDDESTSATPIKVVPIQRQYEADKTETEEAPVRTISAPAILTAKTGRKVATSPSKALPAKTVAPSAEKPKSKAIVLATVPAKATSPAPVAKAKPAKSVSAKPIADTSRTRLVPVSTVNIPTPAGTSRKKIVVSEIEKIVVPKAAARKRKSVAVAPVPATPAAAPVKKTAPSKKPKPAAGKSTATKTAAKPSGPSVIIPEFEEPTPQSPMRTTSRNLPDKNSGSSKA